MIGTGLEVDDSRNGSLPPHQLDELARVYARAAARAYFAKLVQEGAFQQRGISSGSPAGEIACDA